MDIWRQPPGGFTEQQRRQRGSRRIKAHVGLVTVAVAATGSVSGYRWVTAVHPVDRSDAIDLFRAEQTDAAVGRGAEQAQGVGKPKRRRQPQLSPDPSPVPRQAHPRQDVIAAGSSRAKQSQRKHVSRARTATSRQDDGSPEKGVYSWATEGYEQVGGARRDFPAETQRIISAHGGRSWTQHHYFSEEREIWTIFQPARAGVEITQQRNKVSFGPVTRETKIDFEPSMLAAPRSLRVGLTWEGEWTGDTYGNYSGKVFEHGTMRIGGEPVEVWGMTYQIHLHGEQEGEVSATVWFAPRPHLTVKEHYVQDVDSGGAQYHAEWMQTLKSLHPRR